MSKVIALSTRITGQHYRVRKDRSAWAVQLVTPAGDKPLVTTIAWHTAKDGAEAHARECSARTQRPYKPGRPSA